jgi:hypothetical protein
MVHPMRKWRTSAWYAAAALTLAYIAACSTDSAPSTQQVARPDISGMYSDAPPGIEGAICGFQCSGGDLEALYALLDDPANEKKPVGQLVQQIQMASTAAIAANLTDAARAAGPVGFLDDPGYMECKPWEAARQIVFAPHQMEIQQHDDRVELHYGEWDARRTIWMDGRKPPADLKPTPEGYAVGRYEGEDLVVETTAISAGIAPWLLGFKDGDFQYGRHSDQLRITERYSRSADGKLLWRKFTLEDPWALKKPLVLLTVKGWAPDQEIAPYVDCEKPDPQYLPKLEPKEVQKP